MEKIKLYAIAIICLIILYFLYNNLNKKESIEDVDYNNLINDVIKSDSDIYQKIYKIDEILNRKCSYGKNMHLLNDKEKDLIYILNLEREVNNGGFNQFYYNSSGNYAIETLNTLRKIESKKLFDLVKKANSEFPNNFIPSNREKRIGILSNIEDKSEKTWKELDNNFYNLKEDYISLLYVYYTSDNL